MCVLIITVGGFSLGLLVGLLYLAAGIVLWLNPLAGIVALTGPLRGAGLLGDANA